MWKMQLIKVLSDHHSRGLSGILEECCDSALLLDELRGSVIIRDILTIKDEDDTTSLTSIRSSCKPQYKVIDNSCQG